MTLTLLSATGINGAFELWMVLDTAAKLAHAQQLVARSPFRWVIQ